jgi:hypothetical protein
LRCRAHNAYAAELDFGDGVRECAVEYLAFTEPSVVAA